MARWQSGGVQDRPKWLVTCEAATQPLLTSNEPIERGWALSLWLLLGHTEHADELRSLLGQLAANKEAQAEFANLALLSWLPTEGRLTECKRLLSGLRGGANAVETLRQCTLIDDPQLADWLFAHLNDASLADLKLRAPLVSALLRSQLGGFINEQFLTTLAADNYEYGRQAPYRIVRTKQGLTIPGRVKACDWLRQRYQTATSDSQRAIALLALAKLDHKTAVDAAIGALRAMNHDGDATQVALSIVFSDAPSASARCATGLLSHPLPAVRVAALRFLAVPTVVSRNETPALIPVVPSDAVLPGLWRATEKFPVDKLRRLAATGDVVQQFQAKLLLVATGEHLDLNQLDRALPAKQREYAKLCIAAALAKAGRNDREAIDRYQTTYADAAKDAHPRDAQIVAALYETLRDLPGDEIAELRRRMRKEKGSKLFNNSSDGLFDASHTKFASPFGYVDVSE